MSYANAAEMIARYGERELTELTDRVGAGVPDAALLERALSDAATEIDGYLRGRYALPPDTVPALLKRIACDIARYLLAAERATDEMRARYEDARKILAAIADGRVRLGLAPAVTDGGGAMEVATGSRPRDWGMLA